LGRGTARVLREVPPDLAIGQVTVRTLTDGAKVELVESRVYTGALTPRTLLQPYVGRDVVAYVWDDPSKRDVARPATLLGLSDDGPIIAIDKETRVLSFGRIAVPKLPDNVRAEPTLELLLSSDREVEDVEITYGSKLLRGSMVYQVVRAPGAATAQLAGLVSLSNGSETPVSDAMLSLTSESTTPVQFGAPGKESDSLTTFVRMPAALTLGGGENVVVRIFGPRRTTSRSPSRCRPRERRASSSACARRAVSPLGATTGDRPSPAGVTRGAVRESAAYDWRRRGDAPLRGDVRCGERAESPHRGRERRPR
jgi:hypothetical protein